ncbi:hypothetical protein V8F20_008559 [Naviculisporaceae sp. PSN 640]
MVSWIKKPYGSFVVVRAIPGANDDNDIDAEGGGLFNALQAAPLAGHPEIVKLLLEKGANPLITGEKYKLPLCAAALACTTMLSKFSYFIDGSNWNYAYRLRI